MPEPGQKLIEPPTTPIKLMTKSFCNQCGELLARPYTAGTRGCAQPVYNVEVGDKSDLSKLWSLSVSVVNFSGEWHLCRDCLDEIIDKMHAAILKKREDLDAKSHP